MQTKIAGVVVLYNPSESATECINSYLDQLSRLYVIDNSTEYNKSVLDWINQRQTITYINNGGNKGIASALNVGARAALADGFTYLLTMDQDTSLPGDYLTKFLLVLSNQKAEKFGILAPRYTEMKVPTIPELEEVSFTMTSGNLLNLGAFQEVGDFMDELFIDHVDHEYCLRLRSYGFRILQLNTLGIAHRPGQVISVGLFGKKWTFSSHSPARSFFMVRNGLTVARLYRDSFPEFRKYIHGQLFREIMKIPFESDKFLRFVLICKALSAYRSNSLGPMKE